MSRPLILIANPGSASRKYALYEGSRERARLHFEWIHSTISYTLHAENKHIQEVSTASTLDEAAASIAAILRGHDILHANEEIEYIGLRVVAPGAYFLQDHFVDKEFTTQLEAAREYAPLHIEATLNELSYLQQYFAHVPLYAISDSAFHSTKPNYAWNYGISLELANKLDIKRFGYHGLSVASAIRQAPLANKAIVCHLGGGASITAVENGKSRDTTMGYSPLEGIIMGTRSGSLDINAANRLKKELGLTDEAFEGYLNTESGLRGLGGSSDIRQLLLQEATDQRARLALDTYVYTIQKSIGQMAASLDGADMLIFTGTVGERSAPIRERIVTGLHFLGFSLDSVVNNSENTTHEPYTIHITKESKAIYVVPAREEEEMVERTIALASE